MKRYSALVSNRDKDEKKLIFAFCYYIAFSTIDGLVNRIANIEIWDSLITKGILYLSFLIGIIIALKRFKRSMLAIPGLIIVLFASSYIFFPYNRVYLAETLSAYIFLEIIPIVFITTAIRDWDLLYNKLRTSSIIVIICAIIYLFLQSDGTMSINYMNYSYQIMFSVMYMVFLSFHNKNIVNTIFSVLGVICIVALGARGTIVGIIMGIFIYILIHFKKNLKSITILLIIAIASIVIWYEYTNILIFTRDIFDNWGINSRTITYMIEGDFFDYSGRDEFWKVSINIIKNNILIGTGMGGDRFYLSQYFGSSGTYTHNIFTEILVHYGVFLGGIMLFLLVWCILRSLFTTKKDGLFYLWLTTVCSNGFLQLLFSSSYLVTPLFFVMIILCQKVIYAKNIRN